MVEFDFLPAWYRQAHKYRWWLFVQGWATGSLALVLAGVVLLVHHNTASAKASLVTIDAQLGDARVLLSEVDRLSERRAQWATQERLMAKLGLRVDAARLVRTLDAAMPAEIALIGFQFETEEKPPSAGRVSLDHRLQIRVQGVSPSEAGLAHFVERLTAVPFFEQVAIRFARNATENGHLLRTFEVTFSVNLNSPMGL